jgi:hypothetical protein
MKIIVGKNATGKTKELLRYSLDNNIPILAVTGSKANSLREKSLAYFSRPANVLTLTDLAENAEISKVLVDDIEKAFAVMLQTHFSAKSNISIVGFTATED